MADLMALIAAKKAVINASRRQKTIKPEDGRSRYRVLPGWRGGDDPTFYHDFGQHFVKDISGDLKAVYICTDKTFGRPCSVCSAVDQAIKASTDDVMVEKLKEAKASTRVLINVLHIDGDAPTEPKIMEVAPTVFAEILNIIQEWGADLLDLEAGRDIIIERTGKGKNTRYSVQVAGKATVIDKSVMKRLANLDEYVAQESEEQARRALTSVADVAGLLPPPAARAVTSPRTITADDMTVDVDDEALKTVEGAKPATAKPEVAEPAKAAAPKEAAPVAAPAKVIAAETDTEDLDKLLADL